MSVTDAILQLFGPYFSWFIYAVLGLGTIAIILAIIFKKRK